MRFSKTAIAAIAISAAAAPAHAEEVSYRELGQLMTITGGDATGAFAVGPKWSESFGASAVGRLGYSITDGAAVGLSVEGGENVVEGIFNLGFQSAGDTSVILTFGVRRENAEIADTGNREWVSQEMYGLALDGRNAVAKLYFVGSDTTANFVGSETYGAEAGGRLPLGDSAVLAATVGYQQVDWNGGIFGSDSSLTGSLDLGIEASDTLRLNVFADHNVSETVYGIGASWARGTMSFDIGYSYLEANDDLATSDDHRISLTLSMPLGGGSQTTRGYTSPQNIGSFTKSTHNSGLLGKVMRRPTYLPARSVVRTDGTSPGGPGPGGGGLTTYYADADGDGYGNPAVTRDSATPPVGYVANNLDCDDSDDAINPDALDVADGIDNDCSGVADDDPTYWTTFYADVDGDGYGDPLDTLSAPVQPAGYVSFDGDCDDTDVAVNPGATEIVDGIDNDCDGVID